MDEYTPIELREIDPRFKRSANAVDALLTKCGLKPEKLEYMAALFDENDNAIACGGYDGATIKCVAVDPDHRGEGLTNRLVTHLEQRILEHGAKDITVFTKPENEGMFTSLAFDVVEKSEKAIILETGHPGIREYANSLAKYRKPGLNGAVVMNCNPFTNGHRYLVEYASKHCDHLHIFVVQEDKSVFPYNVRVRLVREGTADLKNVTVHDGGPYIISNSTFPSYFLKKYSDVTYSHARLDIKIFAHYIAPAMDIKVRFVGEEPTDKVTDEYNRAMIEILPKYGMDAPVIIKRKELPDGHIISASDVRRHLAEGDIEEVKAAVPPSTYKFLVSDEALPIIEKLKANLCVAKN